MHEHEEKTLCFRLTALSTGQEQGVGMGMQGAGLGQQGPQQLGPSLLSAAAMYGEAPSLPSEDSLSQRSSVASLQQMLASGQMDERLLSTLQGLNLVQPGIPSTPGALAGLQGMGLGQAPGLQQPHLGAGQQQGSLGLMASSSDASGDSTSAGSLRGGDVISEQASSAHQLWQALAQAEAGQPPQVRYIQPCTTA